MLNGDHELDTEGVRHDSPRLRPILRISNRFLRIMGYKLVDCGDHWRTQALYRDGDNKTALKIYKNTGVWMDFVVDKGSKPFEALVRETLKGDDANLGNLLAKIKNSETPTVYKKKDTIEMEKIYPTDSSR